LRYSILNIQSLPYSPGFHLPPVTWPGSRITGWRDAHTFQFSLSARVL